MLEAAWAEEGQEEPCEATVAESELAERGTGACTVCRCMAIAQLKEEDSTLQQQTTLRQQRLTNLRSFRYLVILEGVELILDMQRRALLGCTRAEEWIRWALRRRTRLGCLRFR